MVGLESNGGGGGGRTEPGRDERKRVLQELSPATPTLCPPCYRGSSTLMRGTFTATVVVTRIMSQHNSGGSLVPSDGGFTHNLQDLAAILLTFLLGQSPYPLQGLHRKRACLGYGVHDSISKHTVDGDFLH